MPKSTGDWSAGRVGVARALLLHHEIHSENLEAKKDQSALTLLPHRPTQRLKAEHGFNLGAEDMRAQGSGDHQRGDGPTPAAVSGRRLTLGTVSLLALMLTAVVTPGRAAGEIAFDIPGGDLGGVLARIGRTGSTSISFPADLTRGRRSGPIVGSMSVQEALSRALAGPVS